MRVSLLLALAPLALAAACTRVDAPQPADDKDAALLAIHMVEEGQMKAFDADDVAGAIAPYGDDSVFIASGMPLASGMAAIRPAFEEMLADPNAKLVMSPQSSRVSASGDLAVTTASYDFTHSDPATGEPVTEHGMNQTVWSKQADGSWKNVSDFNVSVPPEAAEGAAAETTEAPAQ